MAKRTYKRRTTKPKEEVVSIEDAVTVIETVEQENEPVLVELEDTPIIEKKELVVKGLSVGTSGGVIRHMQQIIGHESHGKFDESTRARLQDWQKKKGLIVTGVLDDATKEKMGI